MRRGVLRKDRRVGRSDHIFFLDLVANPTEVSLGLLHTEDVPKPELGSEQIVVKIEASGLCHTDSLCDTGPINILLTNAFLNATWLLYK
jgi:hypothetical protein